MKAHRPIHRGDCKTYFLGVDFVVLHRQTLSSVASGIYLLFVTQNNCEVLKTTFSFWVKETEAPLRQVGCNLSQHFPPLQQASSVT